MKDIMLVFSFLVCSVLINAQTVTAGRLKNGDLLFQNLDCGDMCDAIEAVTTGWHNRQFSHVGIVEKINDTIYVWESMGPGVRKVLLAPFRKRSGYKLAIGRLKAPYQKLIPAALRYIHRNEGVGYDDAFLYNNGKYYCSELIYDAFKYAHNGKPIFKLYPMTFKQPHSPVYFPVWVEYYRKLNMAIPEGEPGCNPGGLSRSDKIKIIEEF
ncbi:MAG: YiiX/YebB-like N1pC/P60 family cysteine hydrolase [Niabella sp.]